MLSAVSRGHQRRSQGEGREGTYGAITPLVVNASLCSKTNVVCGTRHMHSRDFFMSPKVLTWVPSGLRELTALFKPRFHQLQLLDCDRKAEN